MEQKIGFVMKQGCQWKNVLVKGLVCTFFLNWAFQRIHGSGNFLLVNSVMAMFADVQA